MHGDIEGAFLQTTARTRRRWLKIKKRGVSEEILSEGITSEEIRRDYLRLARTAHAGATYGQASVNGDKATVPIENRNAKGQVELVREEGEWKIDAAVHHLLERKDDAD